MSRSFPDGFQWGTATAAHQVEGGNWNNDWWAWEHADGTPCVEPSGDACDQYHRYEDDIRLLAALGFGSYRFSLEWSRIEPEEGHFSVAALDHYRRVAAACLANGIRPVVTFHHFTSPRWVAADGAGRRGVDRFTPCERSVALGDLIDRACTINEPDVVVRHLRHQALPAWHRRPAPWRRRTTFCAATPGRSACSNPAVARSPGLTLSMADYQAVPADDPAAVAKRNEVRASVEDRYLELARTDDFVGVQTYSRTRVGPDGELGPEEGVPVLPMGYEYYPESLAATIRQAWAVTEAHRVVTGNASGPTTTSSASTTCARRSAACSTASTRASTCSGTCWARSTTSEWASGTGPFGIIDVDRTQQRIVKASGHWLGASPVRTATD
jgi:beta-glucosidase